MENLNIDQANKDYKDKETGSSTDQKLWFRRKVYGWGWQPVSWEGWVVTFLYVVILVLSGMQLEKIEGKEGDPTAFIIIFVIATALLMWTAYKRGEKPRWQWGPKKDDIKEE